MIILASDTARAHPTIGLIPAWSALLAARVAGSARIGGKTDVAVNTHIFCFIFPSCTIGAAGRTGGRVLSSLAVDAVSALGPFRGTGLASDTVFAFVTTDASSIINVLASRTIGAAGRPLRSKLPDATSFAGPTSVHRWNCAGRPANAGRARVEIDV